MTLEQSLWLRAADDLEDEANKLDNPEEAKKSLWEPNPANLDGTPNMQYLVYKSKADVVGAGGSAGSGKTDLLLGLALKHKRSAIFRRVFPSLRGIIERSREIYNPERVKHGKDTFNESLHRWVLDEGDKIIEFEACQYEDDKRKQQGRARDFIGFDEVTEMTRSQVEFISAWCRSVDPLMHCQVVMTFNPPTDDDGQWVVDYFLPWIAHLFPDTFTHPNPALPGELRWYATVDGKELECEDGKPFNHNGEEIRPRSRTFIPGKLADNPHLANTNYASILHSLPEPLRSQLLKGDFAAAKEADPWQVIPIAWVKAAQRRWLERERPENVQPVVGLDVTRGGNDRTCIAKRYDNWIDEIKVIPGKFTHDGPTVAALVNHDMGDIEPNVINVDVIGIGSSPYDSLKEMYNVKPINAGEASSYRDRSGKLKMRNVRAEMHWKLMEALDPVHGDNLCLPPGNEIVADLCAARYQLTTAGVQIESKDDIKKRIGRSPDVGEAIMLSVVNTGYQGILWGSGG